MSYQEIAYAVMKEFLTDFTEEELKTCINNAYDSKFDTEEIAVTKKVKMEHIIWNYSMEQPSHLKIWHYLFCHIYL